MDGDGTGSRRRTKVRSEYSTLTNGVVTRAKPEYGKGGANIWKMRKIMSERERERERSRKSGIRGATLRLPRLGHILGNRG